VLHFYATANFRHIKLDQYAKGLHALTGVPNELVILSDPERDKVRYYLSTLSRVQKKLLAAKKSWPKSAKSHDPEVRHLLKTAGWMIPAISSRAAMWSAYRAVGAGAFQNPILLHVQDDMPANLLFARVGKIQDRIPRAVREVVSELVTIGADVADSDATESRHGYTGPLAGGQPPPPMGTGYGSGRAGGKKSEPPSGWGAGRAGGKKSEPPSGWGRDKPPTAPVQAPLSAEFVVEPTAPIVVADFGKGGWSGTKPTSGDEGDKSADGPAFLPVYPEIEITNPHPVQGSTFDVSVSLNLQTSEETEGIASAPADNDPHIFDVHLLLGKESCWGQLRFQRPKGTTEKAEFEDVKAPVLEPGKHGIEEHALFDVYVNFYLENRWCGEAVRRIEVRPSQASPKLAVIAKPEAPAWRKDLNVAPGTEPPDLLIRIKKVGPLEFEWNLFSPFMNFPRDAEQMRMSLSDPPYRYVKDHFEVFAGTSLSDDQVYTLNANCDLIYQATPTGFRKGYRDLAAEVTRDKLHKRFETIQIVSDEAFIPWELMRVSDPGDTPAFPPEILCVRHCVGRWMASDSSQLRNALEVESLAVSASDYKTQNVSNLPPLPWAEEERKLLISKPYDATDVRLQLPKLLEFLWNGSAEIIHFSCHGNTDVQVPDQATLNTEDDKVGLRAPLVSTPEVRAGVGKHHPLIFLNACQAGESGTSIGMVFGWPQAFLQMGATACIAPLWKVVDARAKDIAEQFYQEALLGKDGKEPTALGETLRNIRAQWKEKKSLTHLGYVLYGDPTTRLHRKPVVVASKPDK
jgi:hypothetical protein